MMVTTDNQPRFKPGRAGVESWFLRANHPVAPRALWLKSTVLIPKRGPAVAEAWCAVFDGTDAGTRAAKHTVPLAQAHLKGAPCVARVGDNAFTWGGRSGSARGALEDAGLAWDLQWDAADGPLGQPLSLVPRTLIDGPFPRNKLLTPIPALTLRGSVHVDGERWSLDGWRGSQGHNWGAAHAPEYAWGQVVFPDAAGAPSVVAEGFTGRIALGPLQSPRFSALTVWRGKERFVFDSLVDVWRQRATLGDLSWTLRVRGPSGEAQLQMYADPGLTVCLGYQNPGGDLSYCHNSKLAEARLQVNPRIGEAFEVFSAHGGALELLGPHADERFSPV